MAVSRSRCLTSLIKCSIHLLLLLLALILNLPEPLACCKVANERNDISNPSR